MTEKSRLVQSREKSLRSAKSSDVRPLIRVHRHKMSRYNLFGFFTPSKICAGIWIYCAALVTPPLLFDWSSYQPEGLLVTCSWDYTSRNFSNRLFYIYLLFFGFVVPVTVLIFSYCAIFCFILRSAREMTRLTTNSDSRVSFSHTTMSFVQYRRRTELRTALCLLSQTLLFLTAWTPYAVVSLIGQFGPIDGDGQVLWLSPLTTSLPSFFAKITIVFNPLVYGFFHPKFRSSVSGILRQFDIGNRGETRGRGGRRRANNELNRKTRLRNPPHHSPLASPAAAIPSPSSGREKNASLNLSTHKRPDVSGYHPRLRGGIYTVLYLSFIIMLL